MIFLTMVKPKPQPQPKKGYVCRICGYFHEGEELPEDGNIDLGGEYVTHGTVKQLYQKHGLDAVSLANRMMEVLPHEN